MRAGIASLLAVGLAAQQLSQALKEVISLGHPTGSAPEFVAVPGSDILAIASNNSAILKIEQLTINPYPLRPGRTRFALTQGLVHDIPMGSTLHAQVWHDRILLFSGSIPICDYLIFAQLSCPVARGNMPRVLEKQLEIPSDTPSGDYSMIAKLTSPDDDLIAHLAVQVMLNSGYQHDEL